jgi:hypothetical protein
MRPALPADFDPKQYLALHPDVANAKLDAGDHYLRYGVAEGRPYKPKPTAVTVASVPGRYVESAPDPQNILDLFSGEWSSAFPLATGLSALPGQAQLFGDSRIKWADEQLGPFQGKKLLELGPLEGAHTHMLTSDLGAAEVVSIEANTHAFLRCLCTKEVLQMQNARFLLGNFVPYVEQCNVRFDAVVACGVLYHLTDPAKFLRDLAKITDRIFLWTHYYDETVIKSRSDAHLFTDREGVDPSVGKARYYSAEALKAAIFSGGTANYAVWMRRDAIGSVLSEAGFSKLTYEFEHPDHQHGPAVAICASR